MTTPAGERARIASNARWARAGAREAASAVQLSAQRRRAEREVDPDGTMTPGELELAVRNHLRERMARVRAAKVAQ